MPSTSSVVSFAREPAATSVLVVCMAELPPTSNLPMLTLGNVAPAVWKFRPVGRASMSSRDNASRRVTDCTSTTGDAPDTVTVSSTPPTLNSTFKGAVKSADNSNLSRTKVLNPVSVNVTV